MQKYSPTLTCSAFCCVTSVVDLCHLVSIPCRFLSPVIPHLHMQRRSTNPAIWSAPGRNRSINLNDLAFLRTLNRNDITTCRPTYRILMPLLNRTEHDPLLVEIIQLLHLVGKRNLLHA